jgi:nicotinate-nucleotide--dimethylbenzimidazole phosphoribosyltransferase
VQGSGEADHLALSSPAEQVGSFCFQRRTMQLPYIPDYDLQSAELAQQRQNTLTKPAGSLGRLEELSIRLAGICGASRPSFSRKAVIVMAGDHGVTAEGVSAYPAAVTKQMVLNFLHGGAAINVLARQAGARVIVVDIGVAADFEQIADLIHHKIANGTHNMRTGPAMTRQQAEESIQVGMEVAKAEIAKGLDLLAVGEMGIGNTTPSSAITSLYTALPVRLVTGRGTGLDESGFLHKVEVIEQSIAVNKPDTADPIDVLSKVGGFEIGGLAGLIMCAASHRLPVVLDGFISGAAALIAAELEPRVKPFLIASHRSVEAGHRAILERLGLRPLLDLDLRLGEGTGAALAFHLIDAAVNTLNDMATFSEAGVSGKE